MEDVIQTRVMFFPSLLKWEIHIDICMVEVLPDDWRKPIIQYLDNPYGKHDHKMKVHTTNYVVYQNELYRKGKDGLLLLYLGPDEAVQAITEVHGGICSTYHSSQKMHWLLR